MYSHVVTLIKVQCNTLHQTRTNAPATTAAVNSVVSTPLAAITVTVDPDSVSMTAIRLRVRVRYKSSLNIHMHVLPL